MWLSMVTLSPHAHLLGHQCQQAVVVVALWHSTSTSTSIRAEQQNQSATTTCSTIALRGW